MIFCNLRIFISINYIKNIINLKSFHFDKLSLFGYIKSKEIRNVEKQKSQLYVACSVLTIYQ